MTNDGHYQPHLITTFTKVDHCAAPPLSNNDDNDIPFVIALDTSWCPPSIDLPFRWLVWSHCGCSRLHNH